MSIQDKIKSAINIIKQVIPLMQDLKKRLQNEEMARRVCKEEGLNETQTMKILATIYAESSFDDKAINKNSNGSTDFGLAQFNDGPVGVSNEKKWWIGEGKLFSSAEEVLSNPEKNVRVMIKVMRTYPRGLRNWYGYQSRNYYRYLQKGHL